MIRRITLLAPLVIVAAAACGSEAPMVDDGSQPTDQTAGGGEDQASTGQAVTSEDAGTSQDAVRGGFARGGGVGRPGWHGGGVYHGGTFPGWHGGGIYHGGTFPGWHGGGIYHGGTFPGWHGGGIYHGGIHRGWVSGSWAPGWGWVGGQWVVGGAQQIPCAVDEDCFAQLGPGAAVCSYDPTVGLGYCVGPGW